VRCEWGCMVSAMNGHVEGVGHHNDCSFSLSCAHTQIGRWFTLARTTDVGASTVHVLPSESCSSAVASKARSWAPASTCGWHRSKGIVG
jgi:hypothetical protein